MSLLSLFYVDILILPHTHTHSLVDIGHNSSLLMSARPKREFKPCNRSCGWVRMPTISPLESFGIFSDRHPRYYSSPPLDLRPIHTNAFKTFHETKVAKVSYIFPEISKFTTNANNALKNMINIEVEV